MFKTSDKVTKSKKYKSYKDKTRIDISHKVLNANQEAGFYTEEEISVNRNKWIEAVDATIKLYFEHEKKGYKSGWPILVRFTDQDDSLLSMTSGRNSVFIDIFNNATKVKDKSLIDYFKAFEKLMIDKFEGRAHYGKKHYFNKNKMKKAYGLNLTKFNQIRKKLDPNNMFSNEYIKRLLG